MNPNTPVKVIFKRLGDDVIALFPALPGDSNPLRTCLSYQHVGQHGAATMDLFTLPPATAQEWTPLMKELESIGYTLRVGLRATKSDRAARIRACGK